MKTLISLVEDKENTIQSLNISNLKLKSELNPFIGQLLSMLCINDNKITTDKIAR